MIKEAIIPKNLSELWKKTKYFKGNICYIAGGTDIVPLLREENKDIDLIVDINNIEEINIIEIRGNFLFIGSAVKISELFKSSYIKRYANGLFKAIEYYASPSIRNIATLGGNLANASPCADGVLALVSCDAKVILNLQNRKRILSIEDVVCGVRKTVLQPNELIEGFLIPLREKKSSFKKIMPRTLFGIAKAGLCMTTYNNDGVFYDVKIACSSVAPKIIVALKTSLYLESKKINLSVIENAKKLILQEISPITDHRSTKQYRLHVISVMLENAINDILND
ncbi:MAG: FAD binding domain-containing protein [Elusimicrobiales bacterium]|nr:FAD binding domain-containing protein [Elusimicrobiales bacterium]